LGGARPPVIYQAIFKEATCSQCAGLCTLLEFSALAATYFYFIQHQMIAIPYRTVYAQSCIVVFSNTPIFFFGVQEKNKNSNLAT
jgi:hypothetical protein